MIVGAGKSEIYRMEIQLTVGIAVLSLKSIGQACRLETQAKFLCSSIEAELLLLSNWLDEASCR